MSLPRTMSKGQEISTKPPRKLDQVTLRIQTAAVLTLWKTKISGCLRGQGKCLAALKDKGFRVSIVSQRVAPTGIRERPSELILSVFPLGAL